jgi:hypothetical protein
MSKNPCVKIKQAIEGAVDFGPHKETGLPYTTQQKLEEMFGVTEQVATLPRTNPETGEVIDLVRHVYGKTIDRQAAKDLDNIGPEAYGRAVLGSGFESAALDAWHDPNFWPRCQAMKRRGVAIRGQEQDAVGDTASMYEPINTWGAFTLGLYDLKILEGYDAAERIYTRLCPTVPTLIRGAQKHILAGYDGTVTLKPVAEGQAADTVGGKPVWIWPQVCDEFQLQWTITMEATMSDLSGGLAARGQQVGEALAKSENYRAAQTYLGYDNKYCFNTVDNSTPSCNTFQGTAGSAPFNYANLFYSSNLIDVDTLNNAMVAMMSLTDPVRGWRMDLGKDFLLLVSPNIAMRAAEIVKLATSYRATTLGLTPTTTNVGRVGEGSNPLVLEGFNFDVVNMGQEWKDVLTGGLNAGNATGVTHVPQTWVNYLGQVANTSNLNPLTQNANAPGVLMSTTGTFTAGLPTGNADGFWMLVSKKHTYMQHQPWIPIRSEIWPLTGDELARRQGIRGGSYVASRNTIIEPRAAQVNLPLASGTL